MITLSVPDMSCGHCVKTIESTVKALDATAKVNADLAAKTVTIEGKAASAAVTKALDDAGYPASLIQS